jgi:hypothetical protein
MSGQFIDRWITRWRNRNAVEPVPLVHGIHDAPPPTAHEQVLIDTYNGTTGNTMGKNNMYTLDSIRHDESFRNMAEKLHRQKSRSSAVSESTETDNNITVDSIRNNTDFRNMAETLPTRHRIPPTTSIPTVGRKKAIVAVLEHIKEEGYKTGGRVRKTGKALVHKDEFVLPVGVKPTKGQKKSVKILRSKSNKV